MQAQFSLLPLVMSYAAKLAELATYGPGEEDDDVLFDDLVTVEDDDDDEAIDAVSGGQTLAWGGDVFW